LTCPSGFVVKGTRDTTTLTRTCMSNGNWSGSETKCIAATCPALPEVSNGQLQCSGNNFADTCLVKCDSGFETIDSEGRVVPFGMAVTCLPPGQWSQNLKCRSIHCGPLVPPVHASGTCKSDVVGSVCEFECHVGYHSEASGGLLHVCQVNGQWSNLEASCVLDQ
jgi:CUB/sushi domain-containing protein